MIRLLGLLWCCLCFSQSGLAQRSLSAWVQSPEGEPLAFVNVLLNGDPNRGVASDIDGRFTLGEASVGDSILLSYLGYEPLTYYLREVDFRRKLRLTLNALAYELASAEVIAGENPAHRIIREAVRQRDRHNPEKQAAYRCQTYNKLVVDWLPDTTGLAQLRAKAGGLEFYRERRIQRIESSARFQEQQHLLLMESLTERSFLRPQHLRETVLHKRVSGFKDPSFVALANSMQPFSCYRDHLELLGKDFLNPISKGSTQRYFFQLEDTLYRGPDTIYTIAFQPRVGSKFTGLKGWLNIHTRGYAIQSISAEPATPGRMQLKIEQRYQLLAGGQWFPDQLNFELWAERYPDPLLGIKLNGRSYIRAVELDPPLRSGQFGLEGIHTATGAAERGDSLWRSIRLVPLGTRELRTYAVLDSLGEEYHFDGLLRLTEALTLGKIPVGPMDLSLRYLFNVNAYEGQRWGLGLATNRKVSSHFSLDAYAAYGTFDERWKWGGGLKLHLFPKREVNLGFRYQRDIEEPAQSEFPFSGEFFRAQSFNVQMDEVERYTAYLEGWFFPYTYLRFSLSQNTWSPDYAYRYEAQRTDPATPFNFTEVGLQLYYAYGLRFTRLLGTLLREEGNFPIFQFHYARGLANFWRGEFDYHRLMLRMEYDLRWRALGQSRFYLEGAWVSPGTPYQKLFGTNGLGREFRLLIDDNEFHTMDPYEFLSNQMLRFHFRHKFDATLVSWKFFQPRLALVHNLAFGSLARPDLHGELQFNTLERGYYEAGIVLDNLVGINYVNIGTLGLGLGTFYRYGPYTRPEWQDNIGIQATLSFALL